MPIYDITSLLNREHDSTNSAQRVTDVGSTLQVFTETRSRCIYRGRAIMGLKTEEYGWLLEKEVTDKNTIKVQHAIGSWDDREKLDYS